MILASWNVNSISIRLPQLLEWLKENKPNVVCLQETKTVDEKFPEESLKEAGYYSAFYGQKSYNGVAILSDTPIDNVEKNFFGTPTPDEARFLKGHVNSVTVLNAYVPNGSYVGSKKYSYKLQWLDSLRKYLDESVAREEKVILCGDFNIAPEDIDIYNPAKHVGEIMCSDAERTALEAIRDWGFSDSFRMHVKETGHYTWWDYRLLGFKRKMGFRIDHIWISQALAKGCQRAWIDVEPRRAERPSDHTPILVEVN